MLELDVMLNFSELLFALGTIGKSIRHRFRRAEPARSGSKCERTRRVRIMGLLSVNYRAISSSTRAKQALSRTPAAPKRFFRCGRSGDVGN